MAAASDEAPCGATRVPMYGWESPSIVLTASKTASWTIAPQRAWKNGFVGGADTVVCMIAFHSVTASARAAQGRAAGSAIASSMATRRKTLVRSIRLLLSLGLLRMEGHRGRRADRAPGRCRAGGGLLGGKDPAGRLLQDVPYQHPGEAVGASIITGRDHFPAGPRRQAGEDADVDAGSQKMHRAVGEDRTGTDQIAAK